MSAIVGEAAEKPRIEGADAGDPPVFTVTVEELAVGCATMLVNALLLWAVAHIVFAQKVRRNARRPVYLFLEHFVLKVKETHTLPRVCWRAAKALKAEEPSA